MRFFLSYTLGNKSRNEYRILFFKKKKHELVNHDWNLRDEGCVQTKAPVLYSHKRPNAKCLVYVRIQLLRLLYLNVIRDAECVKRSEIKPILAQFSVIKPNFTPKNSE